MHKKLMKLPKVLITRSLPAEANALLLKNRHIMSIYQFPKDNDKIPRHTLLKEAKDSYGILCLLTDKIDTELLDSAPNLKCVSTMSVGLDHVDINECKKRNISIGYTPGVLDDTTAELAVALLFATTRRIVQSANSVVNGTWGTWSPLQYTGMDIIGKTVGIVGMGRIGSRFAKMLSGMDVEILYTGPNEKPEYNHLGTYCENLEELLLKSDIVSVHCPLNTKTNQLFGAKEFTLMKKDAVFINTSRGPVVDQEALYDALVNGEIQSAGLDVTTPEPLPHTHKLLGLDNCTVLPHIGSASVQTRSKMAVMAVENLIAGIQGTKLPYLIQ